MSANERPSARGEPGGARPRRALLPSSAIQSLRALLVMVEEPQRWHSVRQLAEGEALPEARLEQLLLKLRRAGVLEARRGRLGGYRLAQAPAALPVAVILAALDTPPPRALLQTQTDLPLQHSAAPATINHPHGGDQGSRSLQAIAPGSPGEPLNAISPEGVPSATASVIPSVIPSATGADLEQPRQAAAARVTAALVARLQRALERELAACTLEDLHHDLRSTRALLSEEGGLLLG